MDLGLTVGDDLDRIARLGHAFAFVEVGVGETASLPGDASAADIRTEIQSIGCDASVHLPFKQALATPVPELNEAILSYLALLLAWAGDLGAEYAVVHATARNPSDTDLRPTAVEQLQAIAATATDHGITLTVENVGHQPTGFPLSVVGELAERAGVPLCFDIGHAYMENGNEAVERALEDYTSDIGYLHLHDVRGRGDTHLPIGAGEVDFELLAARWSALQARPALEIFTDDRAHLVDSAERVTTLLDGSD